MPNEIPGFDIFTNKEIQALELANLFASVGWGEEAYYEVDTLERSIAAYPLVAHCRDADGLLVGYASAFTDGAFSTFIGELVVRPEFQRRGIGSALLELILEKCRGVPVYGTPYLDTQNFFLERGFRIPKRGMSVVSMHNAG